MTTHETPNFTFRRAVWPHNTPRTLFKAALIRLTQNLLRFARSCSQIRITLHLFFCKVRFTRRSLALFAINFRSQKLRLFAGVLECLGQPCQKQPSTKMATRARQKMKSGLPNMGWWRRQPVIWCRRNNFINASSVSLLPCPESGTSLRSASPW